VISLLVKRNEITVMSLLEGFYRMAKAGRGSDQFPLRLPDGLRDRIKTFATLNGYSMNSAIVQVLELYFPEPFSLEERMGRLADMARGLRELPSTPAVDKLIDELRETLAAVASGRGVTDEFTNETERANLRTHLGMWNLEEREARQNRSRKKKKDG
jgi:hypothetical protein